MKFDNRFQALLQQNLAKNKLTFYKGTVALIKSSVNNYYRNILFDYIDPNGDYVVDVDYICEVAEKIILSEGYPIFLPRKYFSGMLQFNPILFNYSNIKKFNSETPGYEKFREGRINLEYLCLNEYWMNGSNLTLYEGISSFTLFNDKIYENSNLHSFYEKGLIFETKNWVDYINNLFIIHFPDYPISKEYSDNTIRFVKEIKKGIYLGFEYDLKSLKTGIRTVDNYFPDVLNMVLFNSEFDKKLSDYKYYSEGKDNIISLGIWGHPMFFYPGIPAFSFILIERERGGYSVEKKAIDPNHTQIVHPKNYGERLKEHAFFFMDALQYTVKPYINFVEQSILESIDQV